MEHEVFPNAPIEEALLDIRVNPSTNADMTSFDAFGERVRNRYPIRDERRTFRATLNFAQNGEFEVPPPNTEFSGYLYKTKKSGKVLQARVDGYSFSKLRPYENWHKFQKEALRHWKIYCEEFKPSFVTRIALRFINRIEIPLPLDDFRDFVLTGPEIAPNLPSEIVDFFSRVVIPDPKKRGTTIIISTIDQKHISEESFVYILDIDVFREIELPVLSKAVWDLFDDLRVLKNEIFFESTTERAKELFR